MVEGTAETVAGVVERYGGDPAMLIPMMQDLQEEHGYLSRELLRELARRMGVPLSRVYSIATFYASFRLMPKGEHTVQLCMGTACHLKGAARISEALQKEFSLVPGGTSPDGKFTFAPVNCVGACALAPVLVIDGEYHGGLTAASAVELLRRVAGRPSGAPAPEGASVPPARGRGRPGRRPDRGARKDGLPPADRNLPAPPEEGRDGKSD